MALAGAVTAAPPGLALPEAGRAAGKLSRRGVLTLPCSLPGPSSCKLLQVRALSIAIRMMSEKVQFF